MLIVGDCIRIIDYLQEFAFMKRGEWKLKKLRRRWMEPSVLPPEQYADRMLRFVVCLSDGSCAWSSDGDFSTSWLQEGSVQGSCSDASSVSAASTFSTIFTVLTDARRGSRPKEPSSMTDGNSMRSILVKSTLSVGSAPSPASGGARSSAGEASTASQIEMENRTTTTSDSRVRFDVEEERDG